MSRRIISLILFLVIVSLVSYVFYLNPGPVTVNFGPANSKVAPLALVLIFTFCLGAILSALIAFAVGVQSFFKEWMQERRFRSFKHHQELIVVGREQLAAKNFDAALRTFRRIIEQDPSNIVARILLAKTFRDRGDFKSALQVLDESRQSQKNNVELLFLAADLSARLGNFTSAYDNLALVLKMQPSNEFALVKIVESCDNLGRYSQAIDFQKQVIRLLSSAEQTKAQEALALLELKKAKSEAGANRQELRQALDEVLKRHKNFGPALAELAFLERDNGELDVATKHWSRAYKLSGDLEHLERLAKTWLKVDDPEKAVTVVRNAVLNRESAIGGADIDGGLFLATLLFNLGLVDNSKAELTKIKAHLPLSTEQTLQVTLLDAYLSDAAAQSTSQVVDALEPLVLALLESELLPIEKFFHGSAFGDGSKRFRWSDNSKLKMRALPQPRLSTP